jgi:hypothetical protein
MEPLEVIDRLLRTSMAAPIPSVPADFDQRVMREVHRTSAPLDRYGRTLLAGYGVASAVVSAVVMRGQGLGWGAVAGMILAPLVLLGAGRSAAGAIFSRRG